MNSNKNKVVLIINNNNKGKIVNFKFNIIWKLLNCKFSLWIKLICFLWLLIKKLIKNMFKMGIQQEI